MAKTKRKRSPKRIWSYRLRMSDGEVWPNFEIYLRWEVGHQFTMTSLKHGERVATVEKAELTDRVWGQWT